MQLDPEGHMMVGGWLLLPRNAEPLHHDDIMTGHKDDISSTFIPASCSTPWEKNMARLSLRVRDVETLIQEDLGDLDEPLTTLGEIARTLSCEHVRQWEVAKAAYDQALLECQQALARILSPFIETQEPLKQSAGGADWVLSPMEAVRR
jgi:hypothetical protein